MVALMATMQAVLKVASRSHSSAPTRSPTEASRSRVWSSAPSRSLRNHRLAVAAGVAASAAVAVVLPVASVAVAAVVVAAARPSLSLAFLFAGTCFAGSRPHGRLLFFSPFSYEKTDSLA
jgi:hypothetical protein